MIFKSLNKDAYLFGSENIIEERCIHAENKEEVKKYLLEKYPQFFPNNKIYEKETKDTAQFFYILIYPLNQWEIDQINKGPWTCAQCGQVHENQYLSRPRINTRLFGDKLWFCQSINDECLNNYKQEYYKNIELPDDETFIKKDSPIYIYKITEKATGKCYIIHIL